MLLPPLISRSNNRFLAAARQVSVQRGPIQRVLIATLIGWSTIVVALSASDSIRPFPSVVEPTVAPPIENPPPWSSRELSSRMQDKLDRAFDIALVRALTEPRCSQLFAPLDRNAVDSLASTYYAPAPARHELALCARGVSAYTAVGGRVTYLCRAFGRLAPERAARVLIHEALHYAGLPEAPSQPVAMTSAEINHLVTANCQL